VNPPRPRSGRSIVGFLTDGSLPRLCAELSEIAQVRVALLDETGHEVRPADAEPQWSVEPDPVPDAPGQVRVPIVVDGEPVGALLLEAGGADARVERTVRFIAAAAAEACQRTVDSRHRVRELSVLFRITSLLAGAHSVQRVLTTALDSALDVFGLDAGSIVLFPDDQGVGARETEEGLVLMASHGLSDAWLADPHGLSRGRLFDRLALAGEVVTSDDLLDDERVAIPERVRTECVRSFLCAGMVFRERPVGVIRLYGRTPRRFTEAEQRLIVSIGQQAALAVEQARLLALQEQERRLQAQLRLASDVQRRMMPHTTPDVPGLDVAARYVPSSRLGGDFYDAFELHGRVGLVVGDVVGKGVAAALLMAHVRASLRAHTQTIDDPALAVQHVNRDLCRDTLENEFATLWLGLLDPASGSLSYCSAGHEPPLVVRVGAGGSVELRELTGGGLVAGIDAEHPYTSYNETLDPGDVLVVYSDGVIDARNFDRARFGRARLREACARILTIEPDADAKRVLEHIRWEMRQFSGLALQADDETLLVARMKPGT